MARNAHRFLSAVFLLACAANTYAAPRPLLVLTEESGEKSAAMSGAQPVAVDVRALGLTDSPGQFLATGLPDDPREIRFVRSARRSDGLLTWVGRVDTDIGPQSVVFTVGDGVVFGHLPEKDGRAARIESNARGTWLRPADAGDDRVEPFGPDVVLPPPPDEASRRLRQEQERLAGKSGGEPVIDVLVVYTGYLLEMWGGPRIMEARIAQLEALSNQAYADSQANVRIRVVGKHLVDYALRNDHDAALGDIRTPGSKPIKIEVDRLREQYGADMVAMLRHFDRYRQTSCGIASLLGYRGSAFDPGAAFSVTGDRGFGGEACSQWTFTHELGHNMGAGHDTETEDGDYGAYPYSRGYRRTLNPDQGFGTVMAYLEGPQARIGYLSNPNVTACMGVPCGEPNQADNARGFGQSAPIIAGFRPPRSESLPGIYVSDIRYAEGDSGFLTATFQVWLTEQAPGPVVLDLFTSNGTAIANGDYIAINQRDLVIPVGQVLLEVEVDIRGDTLVEREEYFALNLANVRGAVVVDGQGIATIPADDEPPVLSVLDTQLLEGDAGTTDVAFTVTLSQPSTSIVTFEAQTHAYSADDFAATEGSDFNSVLIPNITVPAGATSAEFTVPAIGDTLPEESERFYVSLSHVTGAIVGDDNAVATLLDDDGGPSDQPRLSVGNARATEGDGGGTVLRFPIQLTQASAGPVSFDLRTVDRSAFAGSDYVARQDAGLRFEPGQVLQYFDVAVRSDTVVEADETLVVIASNVSGARPVRPRGFGTILNDDYPGLVQTARDDRFVLGENAGPALLDVLANDQLEDALARPGQMRIQSAPALGTATIDTAGTATPADDTVRYVPPGDTTGSTSLNYEYCVDGGICHRGRVEVIIRPLVDVDIEADAGAGFRDLRGEGLRVLPSLGLSTTPLVAPVVRTLYLPPATTVPLPWDVAPDQQRYTRLDVPATPAGRWRVLADLHAPGGNNVDLYVGRKTTASLAPLERELDCVSAMDGAYERCELEIETTGEPQTLWFMGHNRGTRLEEARLEVFLVPPTAPDGTLVATGPGRLAAEEAFDLRLGWRDHGLLPGETRVGYVDVGNAGTPVGSFPVRIIRINPANAAVALDSGREMTLRLAPGTAQDRLFIDVPAGASHLDVQTRSDSNIDVYLAPAPSLASSPGIAAAPPRAQAVASGVAAGGNESVSVSGAALTPGRWYITPVNNDDAAASLALTASVAAAAPVVRPGSYFNPSRSGHGLFLYPAGDQWAGLWYTYLQDGSATWYYLQGAAPDGDGLWSGELYRAAWNGSGNQLTAIGRGIVTPTAPDAFLFSYELDGETGSEPFAAFGRGCPGLAGQPLDASSHWFDPARAGTGYSVQLFPDYEFHAAFVYDRQGVPRFLTSESPRFLGADAVLPLEQLQGFCPLCAREGAPQRAEVGTLRRRFEPDGLVLMAPDAIYTGGVPGAWSASDDVQLLGGPGTAQGCATE